MFYVGSWYVKSKDNRKPQKTQSKVTHQITNHTKFITQKPNLALRMNVVDFNVFITSHKTFYPAVLSAISIERK